MLRDHGLPALNEDHLKSTSPTEIIRSVVETLGVETSQKDDHKEDQKERRERLNRILKRVDKYTKIVDTAVQHSPEVTALVWAGIRGILQVRTLYCRWQVKYILTIMVPDILESLAGCGMSRGSNVNNPDES